MTPEHFKRIQTAPSSSPILPSSLLKIEENFLKILTSKNLSTPQKLALYNNALFNSKKNNGGPTTVINNRLVQNSETQTESVLPPPPLKKVSSETQTSNDVFNTSSQTSAFMDTPLKRMDTTDDFFLADSSSPKLNRQLFSAARGNERRQSLFDEMNEIDLSKEKDDFIEKIKSASGRKDFDLRDITVQNMSDNEKDYAIIHDQVSGDVLTVEKPPKRREEANSTVKRTRIRPRVDYAAKDFPSSWSTYEKTYLQNPKI